MKDYINTLKIQSLHLLQKSGYVYSSYFSFPGSSDLYSPLSVENRENYSGLLVIDYSYNCARNIYHRKVGGYVKDRMWEEEAEDLRKAIVALGGIELEEGGYYRNGYDAPNKFFNRRNEVWWVRKEK